jgi:D-serine deaminase-like pyridoxal phosphate-dependent protein
MRTDSWYQTANVDEVDSPALLVYPDRVEENLRRMIGMVGDVRRLRPHMKTHKLPEVIRLQLAGGVSRFKCATIAEAEMTAASGAAEVLLAHQPVGPKVGRLVQLARQFPKTLFSTIVDDAGAVHSLSAACAQAQVSVEVLLDIDCGMHRTGIEPGPKAVELYQQLATRPGLKPGGLHAYDGHIRESDPVRRAEICQAALAPVRALREELCKAGLPVPRLVAGGTPTFPVHARQPDVECSPGTCVFWDAGYAAKCPDMDFLNAALVLTRVVSKPGGNRLCLDLGLKAIASENPPPRVIFLNLPGATAVSHSEEHLVVETELAGQIELGSCLYGVPWHVCPTVALYSEAVVVRSHREIIASPTPAATGISWGESQARERWEVLGRNRRLTV